MPVDRGGVAASWVTRHDDGSDLALYVTPRAGRSDVAGEREGALWVKLAAAPVEGAANEALLAWLARRLDVPKSTLRLVAGAASRRKRVRIIGLGPEEVFARLHPPPVRPHGSEIPGATQP